MSVARSTAYLWANLVVGTLATVWLTRTLLIRLGDVTFGVYVATSVTAIALNCIPGALQASTIRSISMQVDEGSNQARPFQVVLIIHIVMAALFVTLGVVAGGTLTASVLLIPSELQSAALIVFLSAVIRSGLMTAIGPFEAALHAADRFDIVALSSTAISIGTLLFAMFLQSTGVALLEDFAVAGVMLQAAVSILLVIAAITRTRFARIDFKAGLDYSGLRAQLPIFGWETLASLGSMARFQGFAIMVNIAGGALASTAYGVAAQVQGSVRQLVEALVTAARPSIYGYEANGDRRRLLEASFTVALVAGGLAALVCVILVPNINFILEVWLGSIPAHAESWTVILLLAACVEASARGLNLVYSGTGSLRTVVIAATAIRLIGLALLFAFVNSGWNFGFMMLAIAGTPILAAVPMVLCLRKTLGLPRIGVLKHLALPILCIASAAAFAIFLSAQLLPGGMTRLLWSSGLVFAALGVVVPRWLLPEMRRLEQGTAKK